MNNPIPKNPPNFGGYNHSSSFPSQPPRFVSPTSPFSSGNPQRDAYLNDVAKRLSEGPQPPKYMDPYWQRQCFPESNNPFSRNDFSGPGNFSRGQESLPNPVLERYAQNRFPSSQPPQFPRASNNRPLHPSSQGSPKVRPASHDPIAKISADLQALQASYQKEISERQPCAFRDYQPASPHIPSSSFEPGMSKIEERIISGMLVPPPTVQPPIDLLPADMYRQQSYSSIFEKQRNVVQLDSKLNLNDLCHSPLQAYSQTCERSAQVYQPSLLRNFGVNPSNFPQPSPKNGGWVDRWLDQHQQKFLQYRLTKTFVSPDPHFASHRDDILLFRNSLEESMQAFYAKEVYHNTLFIDLTEARMPAHDHSSFPLKSFQESARKIEAFSVVEFTKGFGKGLPKGMYDSGKGLASCAVDLLIHPGDTLGQMADAIELFSNLIRSKEWEALGQALSPEAHQLITRWDELNSYTKGNLTGYVIGKFGADILVPGAAMKVVSRGARGAREMVFMARNLRVAEGALLPEIGMTGISRGVHALEEVSIFSAVEATALQISAERALEFPFNFTGTAYKHMLEPARMVPMHILDKVIQSPMAVVSDPRNASNAMMYYSRIFKNGKIYNIEVLYEKNSNKIMHFLYVGESIGPLGKISKTPK